MYQKLLKEEWLEHKLERLITQVLKFGMIGLMIQNAIYGHLDV